MSDIVSNLPNIFFDEKQYAKPGQKKKCYASFSNINPDRVRSSFGIALHMHQPTIPAGGWDLRSAGLISNLQHMFDNQGIGDNHNAGVFFWCYHRLAQIIPDLVREGKSPRVMLDYSGNLLWGLRQMNNGEALEKLKIITCDSKYYPYVEWLGTMWSHAVVTSTPVPDIKLHLMAFRHHFASIFGQEAEQRIKGFSAPEMHLPIHPDVCYEYVKALKECGYEWLMVQEHTIENLDGRGIGNPHVPHKLVARNSLGKVEEITVLIKTQGSDTKLVAQMQPLFEARGLSRQQYCGKSIPPFVCQIGDGENGGVMMNEFPPMYTQCIQGLSTEGAVALNGSEYLEFLEDMGVNARDFTPVQPISQHRIWRQIKVPGPNAADIAIQEVQSRDSSFNLDRGSWTNDRNWVRGYEQVMSPINQLSAAFHERFDGKNQDRSSRAYQEALLYLMLSQTSCFRYWGQGVWTDYARELCRRGMEAVNNTITVIPVQGCSQERTAYQARHSGSSQSSNSPIVDKQDAELLKIQQVIQEIEKHKWYESEKAGHDVGFEWASQDWLRRYAKAWRDAHR